jgi:hypothetical protein
LQVAFVGDRVLYDPILFHVQLPFWKWFRWSQPQNLVADRTQHVMTNERIFVADMFQNSRYGVYSEDQTEGERSD